MVKNQRLGLQGRNVTLKAETGDLLYCPVDAPEALAIFTRGELAAYRAMPLYNASAIR